MDKAKVKEVKSFSQKIKMEVVKMISKTSAGHVGGALSETDLLAVLYEGGQLRYDAKNPKWDGRDWLVISKGHSGPALYSTLALKGFFPMEMLDTLNKPGTDLPSHCDRNHTPGVDMTTGSLGQGASTAAGVALGFKMDGKDNKVFLVLGDGEINEGQVWEMALFASTRGLDNLIAFIDYNKLQLDGPTNTNDIINMGDIRAKFESFGWNALQVNGHDIEAIDDAINKAKSQKGKPTCIVLDTIKGHGWSAIENTVGSHSMGIKPEQLEEALSEMQGVIDSL